MKRGACWRGHKFCESTVAFSPGVYEKKKVLLLPLFPAPVGTYVYFINCPLSRFEIRQWLASEYWHNLLGHWNLIMAPKLNRKLALPSPILEEGQCTTPICRAFSISPFPFAEESPLFPFPLFRTISPVVSPSPFTQLRRGKRVYEAWQNGNVWENERTNGKGKRRRKECAVRWGGDGGRKSAYRPTERGGHWAKKGRGRTVMLLFFLE